ncbi:MAG: MEDS domain-containing protein [Pseudonocardiaceae bacterium]
MAMPVKMAESVKLGIPGVSVPQGTHLCGFFRGREERDDLVFPYLHEGLRSGDKCLCAFEAADREALHDEVSLKVDLASAGEQLDIILPHDVYVELGEFSVPDTLGYWDTWATSSLAGGGFSAARVVGEMTWAVTQVIGAANLIRYECELNRFVPRYPLVMVCLYDLDHFRGDLLVNIMKTHPKVLMGSTVLDNLYYVPPDELVATRQ